MKQASSRPPLQVLIVADGETEATRLVEAVRLDGQEVEFARVESAEALLATLPLAPWDVVLCGYPLLQLTPRDALLALRGVDADRPFIVAVDSPPLDEVVALLKAGANDVVGRDPPRLRAAVEREIQEASAQRARREATQKQREDDEQRRLLIDEMPALTYVAWADDVGATVYVSPQVSAMTGFSTAEWLAEPESWLRCIHAEDRERVLAEFRDCCATGRPFSAEYRILDREGRVRWWQDQGRIIPAEAGRSRFVRGFVVDVTDRKQAEETIRHMRHFDPLTGLPNKALLLERLAAAIASARGGQSIGLLVLSLDGFREINNTLGALNADRIIQQIARRVGEVLGGEDRVARLRGDEFAMLLPDADARLAQQVASKLLRALEQPVMVERLPIEVAGSLGISVYPEHGDDPEALLRRADLAVQRAKREARGSVVYSKECDPYDPRRLTLLGELRRALETDELVLFYQPKVDLKTRRVVGAEALVRWRHPKRGLVPPDDFIPLAEKGGLIKPLTRWVLGRAVERCHAWEGGRRPLSMAVNFSARNLHDSSLAGDVAALLASHSVPSGRLEAELTESAVMSDPARAVETLRQLQASGVGISIDDFGIGQSSLSYLQTLPVTELKIDKSFVIGMASNGDSNAVIVRATSDLGHALGLTVVAEGVEDEATLERLTAFGCDKAQGYHIAKPMAAPDIERWLTDSPWAAE